MKHDNTPVKITIPAWVRDEFMPAMNERVRQVDEERFTPERDDEVNKYGELACAAAAYAVPQSIKAEVSINQHPCSVGLEIDLNRVVLWPSLWHDDWFKPEKTEATRVFEIDKAMALLAAERSRLVRKHSTSNLF